MKVIDLLNKIANGEEVPKKIKVGSDVWNYNEIDYKAEDDRGYLFEVHTRINKEDMNEEVEIIEEDKKIEKLIIGKDDIAWCEGNMKTDEEMVDIVLEIKDKINEIIDYLEENI